MARAKREDPILIEVRPSTLGINVSAVPQLIDAREATLSLNVRPFNGIMIARQGISSKYFGADGPIVKLDRLTYGTSVAIVAITDTFIYSPIGDELLKVAMFDGINTTPVNSEHITWFVPSEHNMISSIGVGTYNFVGANNAQPFYGPIMLLCTAGVSGTYAIALTSGETSVEAEKIVTPNAPITAQCVAVFDDRAFFGNMDDDTSLIAWSSKGVFDDFDAQDSGFVSLTDTQDKIVNMLGLGDYLIVYKERSIYAGRKTYQVDPPVIFDQLPSQGVGLAAPNSVVSVGDRHFFLGHDNVYSLSLSGLEPIGDKIKDILFYSSIGILPEYRHKCFGMVVEEFNEYWLVVPTEGTPKEAINLLNNPTFSGGYYDDDIYDDVLPNWHLNTYFADPTKYYYPTTNEFSSTAIGMAMDYTEGAYRLTNDAVIKYEGPAEYVASLIYSITLEGDIPEDAKKYVGALCDIELIASPATNTSIQVKLYNTNGTIAINRGISDKSIMGDVVVDASVRVQLTPLLHEDLIVADGLYPEDFYYIGGLNIVVKVELYAIHFIKIDDLSDTHVYRSEGINIGYGFSPLGGNAITEIPFLRSYLGDYFPGIVWAFNYKENSWSCFQLPMTAMSTDTAGAMLTIDSLQGTIDEQSWRFDDRSGMRQASVLISGSIDGRVYEHLNDNVFDIPRIVRESRAFPVFWESKDFDLDRSMVDKTFSSLSIFHNANHAAVPVTIGVSADSGTTWDEQEITIAEGKTNTLVDFFVTANQLRFRISAKSPGFRMAGFSLKIVPRGEYRAYDRDA